MKRKKLLKSTLCLLMALVCNVAWAQTFVQPETGKYYKIKGTHSTNPWLTATVESGGIDVAANEADAAVYLKTENGLQAIDTEKYIGTKNSQISLVDNEETVTIEVADNDRVYIKTGGRYLYNNQADYTREAGNLTAAGADAPKWGFIEVKVGNAETFTPVKQTTAPEDGYYLMYSESTHGDEKTLYAGWVHYNASLDRKYRVATDVNFSSGLTANQAKYVWKLVNDNTNSTFTLQNVGEGVFMPADGSRGENMGATTTANLAIEAVGGDGNEGKWFVSQKNKTYGGNSLYIHANTPGGYPNLSYWDGKAEDGTSIRAQFYKVPETNYTINFMSGADQVATSSLVYPAGIAVPEALINNAVPAGYLMQNYTLDGTTYTVNVSALPANGYYHMSSKATSRKEHLYNDATHTGNGGRITLQSDTKVTTNNGIWYITNLGDNKIGIKNGDGNPIKADKGTTAGAYNELTIGATTTANGIDYYYFDVALNCANSGSGYTINGIDHLTTWADGGSGKDDNLWRLEPVSVEGKTIYEVVVDHADGYVVYNNGTTVQNAFNGGFFITEGAITAEQLSAAILDNELKDGARITIEGTTITLSGVKPLIVKQDLYNTSKIDPNNLTPPYRIPGITTAYNGRLITAAARLVCGTDPGYGQVDVVCRYSDDHGDTWSEMIDVAVGNGKTSATVNYFETAFGDPAIVADRTSSEVLIIAVAGCTVYGNGNTTRLNPNMIATIHSDDYGDSWDEPVNVTEQIYSLFDSGNPIQAAFVGGGKIFQSRIVKVGKYYRLYAAMCARPNGNRVIYSDDFGRTWHALGGASALPAPDGDEPKCEELPDGRVILSSRVTGGRIYNIYTYTNTSTGAGSWEGAVTSTFQGAGHGAGGNSTNGELLIVPVKRNSDQKEMYLALQSLPTGSGRSHVGIYYKELTDVTDINSVASFATDWNGFYLVTDKSSAYSSMDLQADDRIGFIYEETLTFFKRVPNPVSTCFPNGEGEHNFDGFDNIYVAYPLELITRGAYSIKRDVSRSAYLRSYFAALAAEASDEVREDVETFLSILSDDPTITEVDRINRVLTSEESDGDWSYFRFKEGRSGSNIPQNAWGYISDNLTTTDTPTNGSCLWKKVDAGEGKFHIVSKTGKYLVPAEKLTTNTAQPEKSWTIEASETAGLDVIYNASVPCQVHALKTGSLTNWGYDSNGARKDDSGCNFEFVSVAPLTISAAGYATLYLDYDVEIPDGVEVYYASRIEGDRLKMAEITDVIPANTGVIVKASEGTYYFIKSATTPAPIEDNLFMGTTRDKYIGGQERTRYYVLSRVDGVVGMYRAKLTDGFFLNNANKAYLPRYVAGLGFNDDDVDTEDQLSNRLRFDFGGTTSIQNPEFRIQNSQIVYDLQGRRVENPTKGIYIVGGRKVVIK